MNERLVQTQIRHNRVVHDDVATSYEAAHPEIFNAFEQARIEDIVRWSLAEVRTDSRPPRVLDFGSGTGNLSAHLLSAGARVVASDVSPASLSRLIERLAPPPSRLETTVLNGSDLRQFPDESFDLVATYSVLHHVPNYLHAVRELIRVTKRGGVVLIDHEAAPSVWSDPDGVHRKYLECLKSTYGASRRDVVRRRARNLFSLSSWKRLVKLKLFGLRPEGDIHVTAEDHINWKDIEAIAIEECEILRCEDYLVCRERAPERPVYSRFVTQCADMRVFVARKVRLDG